MRGEVNYWYYKLMTSNRHPGGPFKISKSKNRFTSPSAESRKCGRSTSKNHDQPKHEDLRLRTPNTNLVITLKPLNRGIYYNNSKPKV